MALTTDKFAKLPKWAQQEFQDLNRELADARSTIRKMKGDDITRVHIDHYVGSKTTRQFLTAPLGIEFELYGPEHMKSPDLRVMDTLKVRHLHGGDSIEVMASSALILTLQASNVVHITSKV